VHGSKLAAVPTEQFISGDHDPNPEVRPTATTAATLLSRPRPEEVEPPQGAVFASLLLQPAAAANESKQG